jgi:hypothetical protein
LYTVAYPPRSICWPVNRLECTAIGELGHSIHILIDGQTLARRFDLIAGIDVPSRVHVIFPRNQLPGNYRSCLEFARLGMYLLAYYSSRLKRRQGALPRKRLADDQLTCGGHKLTYNVDAAQLELRPSPPDKAIRLDRSIQRLTMLRSTTIARNRLSTQALSYPRSSVVLSKCSLPVSGGPRKQVRSYHASEASREKGNWNPRGNNGGGSWPPGGGSGGPGGGMQFPGGMKFPPGGLKMGQGGDGGKGETLKQYVSKYRPRQSR